MDTANTNQSSPIFVWGIATLMVFIISCCSLIGVSIMPLISGPSYKTFITLFTGLAVGSLLGSAIFSLIPQAFNLHKQPFVSKDYLWKSLIIFFGIYLFYCSERLMRIYFERRTRQKSDEEQQIQLRKTRSSTSLSTENKAVLNDQGDTSDSKIITQPVTELSLSETHYSDGGPAQENHGHHHQNLNTHEIITKSLRNDAGNLPKRKVIAPVAWMIIIGDGLHNFIDGLSIGAAFSEGIYLGLTTSVAVIFEEFPHELGDFAVLISSGMSVRQALSFNFLSACTCFIGMIFGILLGDMTQSASYIFALAGGMFLYISLVDMMGELSAMLEEVKHSTKESTHLLLMQNIGILSGIIIIFTLSLYFNA